MHQRVSRFLRVCLTDSRPREVILSRHPIYLIDGPIETYSFTFPISWLLGSISPLPTVLAQIFLTNHPVLYTTAVETPYPAWNSLIPGQLQNHPPELCTSSRMRWQQISSELRSRSQVTHELPQFLPVTIPPPLHHLVSHIPCPNTRPVLRLR